MNVMSHGRTGKHAGHADPASSRVASRRVLGARVKLSALIVFVAFCSFGCRTTIVQPAAPSQPREVFIIDYGRHTSLILPRADSGPLVEYAYGEWDWFALDKSRSCNLFLTLLWPTRGTLGRWEWDLKPNAESMRHHIWCEDVLEVTVESSAITDLLTELDTRFQHHMDTLHYQARYQLDFVHDDGNYWAFHNCNHVLAEWMRELGCEVRGFAMLADFRVRETKAPTR